MLRCVVGIGGGGGGAEDLRVFGLRAPSQG